MKLKNLNIQPYFTMLVFVSLLSITIISCKDFITIDPPSNQLITTTVFEDELTAKAAVLGLYTKMASIGGPAAGSVSGVSYLAGLCSDELTLTNFSNETSQFANNNILSRNSIVTNIWNLYYEYIYSCNALIEGLEKSTKLTESLKKQLKGEATFLRAYSHFYLVNLFGKIPYVTTTNYELNNNAGRQEISEVYDLMTIDLHNAKNLLAEDYAFSNGRRTQANRFAASALLARVYLFMGKNAEAEVEASFVINNTALFTLEDVKNVFLTGSRESILQLGNNNNVNYTNDGNYFNGTSSKFNQSLSNKLITSFEINDLRRINWIQNLAFNGGTIYRPSKYNDNRLATSLKEKFVMLRLAEQFLIRAEARARQDKIVGLNSASSDLNLIRGRAGLNPVLIMTKDEILNAILLERNHELFTEMGTRWLDLKRLMKADAVLAPIKSDWQTTDVLYPIPFEETLVNKNLTQNPGYN